MVAGIVLTASACLAPAPAHAAPSFGDPIEVAPGDDAAFPAAAAYTGARILELAWTTVDASDEPILSGFRRPPGSMGFDSAPLMVTGAADYDGPVLARGPDGQIVAAWVETSADTEDGRIFASVLDSAGVAENPVPVSGEDDDAAEPAIAVGADGRPAIAWTVLADSGDRVQVAHGALNQPLTLVDASSTSPSPIDPAVAFANNGVLQVAFASVDDEEESHVMLASEMMGGGFASPRRVSPLGVDATEPSIAPAPATANLAVAWTEDDGDTTSVKVGTEEAMPAGVGTFSVPGAGASEGGKLAIDPASGALTVAWIRKPDAAATQGAVIFGERAPGGAINELQTVSDADAVAVEDEMASLDLTYSPAADAALTWRRSLGDTETNDIRAAVFDTPAPPPPPPPPPPAPPPLALTLSGFGVAPKCIRYGAPSTGKRQRLTFGFVLSEAASVKLTIQRRLNSGVQRRCPSTRVPGPPGQLGPPVVVDITGSGGTNGVAVGEEGEAIEPGADARTKSKKGQKKKKAKRRNLTVTRRLKSGTRRIVLRQAAATLAPGTYIARVTAATADGRTSTTLKVKFWVLRRTASG